MSWLYWYTKYKQYKDPRIVVGNAMARLDPAAADVYKLKVATPDDVARFISYTVQNNLMSIDDWAYIFNMPKVTPDFLASVLNSQYMPASDAAAILNSQYMPASSAATILNSQYMLLSRAAAIVSSQNLSGSKRIDILKNANISADRVQSILYNIPFPDRLIDILTDTAPDVTLNANATFTGVNIFRTLNLNGYTYTADGQPHVVIAYRVIIPSESYLIKTTTGGPGGGPGATYGGRGGGGLIIFAYDLVNYGVISADGFSGGFQDSCFDNYAGRPGGGGALVVVAGDAPGVGGDGGAVNDRPGGKGVNGGGGGAIPCRDAGNGGSITITSYSSYADLVIDVKKSVIDWVIVNVLGKSPSKTTPLMNIYGAGGGGGTQDYTTCGCNSSAGGGGSGGQVIVVSNSVDSPGTISAYGGNGGNATKGDGAGGGGGGGGIVYVLYKELKSLGVLNVDGGEAGSGRGTGQSGSPGTAGTAKAVAI